MNRKRGFTLIELLVVISIIVLLMGILLPALNKARAAAVQAKDATQLQQIHKSFMTYASQNDGDFPTPGNVNTDGNEPGEGEPDPTWNTTQDMFSLCIAQNYFSPQLVYSPAEVSGNVLVKQDYNHDMYDPIADTYWDEEFYADLDADDEGVSHVSYAHSGLTGDRGRRQWRDSLDSDFALIGNRGVEEGSLDPDTYRESITLEFHGGSKQWEGNVGYADGHVNLEDNFTPEGVNFTDESDMTVEDNIFEEQTTSNQGSSGLGSGYDCFLVVCTEVADENTMSALEWD